MEITTRKTASATVFDLEGALKMGEAEQSFREAVEEFQKAEALEPSGTLTDETLAKLGVDRSPAASPATQPGPTEPGKAKSPAR